MTNCKDCKTNCVYRGKDNEARCGSFVGTVTNADRIRAMSDEELAKSLSKTVVDVIFYFHGTEKTVDKLPKEIWDDLIKEYLDWLKQPAN